MDKKIRTIEEFKTEFAKVAHLFTIIQPPNSIVPENLLPAVGRIRTKSSVFSLDGSYTSCYCPIEVLAGRDSFDTLMDCVLRLDFYGPHTIVIDAADASGLPPAHEDYDDEEAYRKRWNYYYHVSDCRQFMLEQIQIAGRSQR